MKVQRTGPWPLLALMLTGCPTVPTPTDAEANDAPDAPLITPDTPAGADAPDATMRAERVIITVTASADAPTRFDGAVVPSHAPEIVYPFDGVTVPPNLAELELHFLPSGGELFELAIEAPSVRLRIFFGCPEAIAGGCVFVPDAATWTAIVEVAGGVGEVSFVLRGVDAAGTVGISEVRRLRLSAEEVSGTLYYWTGAGVLERLAFGMRGAVPETFLTAPAIGASTCIGCHALSRDGSRVAVGAGIPGSELVVLDVATRTPVFRLGGGAPFPMQPMYFAFDPSSPPTEMVTSSTSGLAIRSAETGLVLTAGLSARPATMPDWAADGDHIVYVRHGNATTDPVGVTSGSIETLNRAGGLWSEGATLVSGGGNNYYPAYAPDGAWVAFVRSPSNISSAGAEGSGDVADAQLMVVASTGAGTPIALSRAAGLSDSWPKWDPQMYTEGGADLYWMTWSSRRGFGLRWADAVGAVQLWMAAFDPAAAARGEDPMSAPFRIPLQQAALGNHAAQWVH